jgi:hypothetical protein
MRGQYIRCVDRQSITEEDAFLSLAQSSAENSMKAVKHAQPTNQTYAVWCHSLEFTHS